MIAREVEVERTPKGNRVTFYTDEYVAIEDGVEYEFSKAKKKRSLDANGLFWSLVGQIAKALSEDKWMIYLALLKSYGKFTYLCVRPNAVEAVKKQWRETEVVGEVEINGQKAVQLLCYYGSSTYDSKEFSHLIDGTISEMHMMGLPTPDDERIERAIRELEKNEQRIHQAT